MVDLIKINRDTLHLCPPDFVRQKDLSYFISSIERVAGYKRVKAVYVCSDCNTRTGSVIYKWKGNSGVTWEWSTMLHHEVEKHNLIPPPMFVKDVMFYWASKERKSATVKEVLRLLKRLSDSPKPNGAG